MKLESINAATLAIPFKLAFKHASAERAQTQSLWIEARSRSGARGHGEGCPREYVTTESESSTLAFVDTHRPDWLSAIVDMASLRDWVAAHRSDIDAHPAAWCAVELALLDLLGRENRRSVENLLGLPEVTGSFHYTAVLGDAAPPQFERQLAHYRQAGFRDFKIKLSGNRERDLAKVQALTAAGVAPQAVRADANNLWRDADAAILHLQALAFRFGAIEEPLQAGDVDGLRQVADALATRIVLDESLLRSAQLAAFADSPRRWIANLRISKMGGLLRSLELAAQVRAHGMGLVIGAHVGETSVLTRAALCVAQASREVLVGQEGAFGTHLLQHDVALPPIMFGAGGVLETASFGFAGQPGWGFDSTDSP